MQYFIIKGIDKVGQNLRRFWTGKGWVEDEKLAKKYKTRRVAESVCERLITSGIRGERNFNMEVLEKLEVL